MTRNSLRPTARQSDVQKSYSHEAAGEGLRRRARDCRVFWLRYI